jgi:hypothetical protein
MPLAELPPLIPDLSTPPAASQVVEPAAPSPSAQPNSINSQPAGPKNPVGRPPKPLLTDAAWIVDQADFAWAKSISRDSIAANRDTLYQKIQQQIRQNQPELLNNSTFVQQFDQAFQAICQTYELTPTARQDILKSLLNGRIIENLVKSLPA